MEYALFVSLRMGGSMQGISTDLKEMEKNLSAINED